MKKSALLLLLLAICAGALGCEILIPSLNPIYKAEDIIFDSTLVGQWRLDREDSDATLYFTLNEAEQTYDMTYRVWDLTTWTFLARLVRIGDYTFFDLAPMPDKIPSAEANGVVVYTHSFVRVEQTESELKISCVDDGWMIRYLDVIPDALGHVHSDTSILTADQIMPGPVPGNGLLLTASTDEIQAFLIEHMDRPDFFAAPLVFRRQPISEHETGESGSPNN